MELEIKNVSKKFGDVWALQDINLLFSRGVVGFLGPNGAGKTTLLRIISTLLKPSAGQVFWCGRDIATHGLEFRRVLGYLPQGFSYYPNFTVAEFLMYIGALKQIDRRTLKVIIPELLDQVGLGDTRNKKMKTLSGGMKQRVGIVQALLNNPQILIVDEPSAGLDPEERMRFRNILAELAGERLVLLSTHIVSDLEAVASQIVLMKSGTIVCQANPDELQRSAFGKVWLITVPKQKVAVLKKQYLFSAASCKGDQYQLRIVCPKKPLPDSIEVEPNLDDAYLLYLSKDDKAASRDERLSWR